MTREEKSVIIEELSEKFKVSPYFYITDASGMSVAQTNDLRRECFKEVLNTKCIKTH